MEAKAAWVTEWREQIIAAHDRIEAAIECLQAQGDGRYDSDAEKNLTAYEGRLAGAQDVLARILELSATDRVLLASYSGLTSVCNDPDCDGVRHEMAS